MERKKIDKLWRSKPVQQSQLILSNYLNEDSKKLFTTSGEKYDSVPNNQAVTDMNADAKALRIGTAWEYCRYCELGIELVDKHVTDNPAPGYYKGATESKYLKIHYFQSGEQNKSIELRELGFGPKSNYIFASLLPLSLRDFAKVTPSGWFNALYDFISDKVTKRKEKE